MSGKYPDQRTTSFKIRAATSMSARAFHEHASFIDRFHGQVSLHSRHEGWGRPLGTARPTAKARITAAVEMKPNSIIS